MLLFAAAPAHAGLAPEEAHSPNADEIRTAYWVMLVLATLLALAAIAGLLAAFARFRDRGAAKQPRRLSAGRGIIGRATAGLAALALGIFVFGVIMNDNAKDAVAEESGEPLAIDVVGQQWLWRFEYPSDREDIATVFSYNELVVPVDTTVELAIDSTDVGHRWSIPALGPQVQAVPGEITEASFRADEEGVYEGQSTQFSGTSYPAMRATVRVVSEAEFDEYLQGLGDDIAAAQNAVQEEVNARAGEEGP